MSLTLEADTGPRWDRTVPVWAELEAVWYVVLCHVYHIHVMMRALPRSVGESSAAGPFAQASSFGPRKGIVGIAAAFIG